MNRQMPAFLKPFVLLTYVLLLAPLVIVVAVSFNTADVLKALRILEKLALTSADTAFAPGVKETSVPMRLMRAVRWYSR